MTDTMQKRAGMEELWEIVEKAHDGRKSVGIEQLVLSDENGYWAAFIHVHMRLYEEAHGYELDWLDPVQTYAKKHEPPPETETLYLLCKLKYGRDWWPY